MTGLTSMCELMVLSNGATDPSNDSVVVDAAKAAGVAARKAERKKRSKWKDLAAKEGAEIVPLAFETTGFRGESLEKFLREMEASSSEGPTRQSLLTQLSVTMQKMNVAMVRQANKLWECGRSRDALRSGHIGSARRQCEWRKAFLPALCLL